LDNLDNYDGIMAEYNHVNENKYKRHQLFTIDAEAVRVLHGFL